MYIFFFFLFVYAFFTVVICIVCIYKIKCHVMSSHVDYCFLVHTHIFI